MDNQNLKFDFVFLGQSVLKYQVPLDIFTAINQIYEQNYHILEPANKQLVGKIESEHSLFYHGEDQKLISFLKPSPISLLPIDKDIMRRLQQFGIRTLGELTLLPTPTLVRQFGEKGEIARTWATGEKIDLVQPNQSLKSIRHSMDFHTPIGNVEILCKSLKKLLETALADLKHQNQSVQGIRIKGVWTKGSWSLNHILRNPSISHEDIYRTLKSNILVSPPTSPIEKLTLEFFQFCTFELQDDFFNHEKNRWEVPNNKKIATGTIPSSLREAITEMKLRMGFSPLYRIDPLSRIPERRHALLNIEI